MTPAYAGPFEMLTVEEAAARLKCSAEHFLQVYDGPRDYLGEGEKQLRFPAWALHEWSTGRAIRPGAVSGASAWDKIGDGEASPKVKKGVSKRPGGAA